MQQRPARSPAHRAARFATLFLGLCACLAVRAQDIAGPARANVAAPGAKGPITIDARSIEGISGIEVTARGDVVLKRDDTTIFSDYLKLNQEFGRVDAQGGVRLVRGADRFFGPGLRYDTRNDTGEIDDAHYVVVRERTARGAAKRVDFLGPNHVLLHDATYTTCRPEKDDWWIEARELDLNYNTEVGIAHGGKLEFLGHTIAATPYASFPLTNARKTGFLAPSFGHNTRRGFEVALPFYWNIAPEQDLTLTPDYMTKRGAELRSDYRFLGRTYSGEARLEYLPHDNVLNERRYGMSVQAQDQITPNLFGQVNLNKVSDSQYFVDLSSNVSSTSVGVLQRLGALSYSGSMFGLGYSLQTQVQNFQTLQDPLAPIVPPYNRTPQIDFSTGKNDIAGRFDLSVPAQYARFTHPTLVEGARFSLNPRVAMPYLAAGYYVTPKIGLHYASYALTNTAPLQPRQPSVSVPWFSLDSGLVFQRGLSWFGEDVTQTLEPRLFYVYAPYRNQDQIPLFDTGVPDFNFAQIFTENRFVGGDRFGDADEVTLALTSRLLTSGGQEALRAMVGQRYYFRHDRVGLTASSPPSDYGSSALLGSLGGRVFRHWTFDTTAEYDPHLKQMQRYSASLQFAPQIAKVLNLSYQFDRTQPPEIRQVDLSGQWPVKPGWYAIGRWNYSFANGRLLEGLAGLEYNAGCWVVRGLVQRLQAAAQTTSNTILFQIQFNGLGQLGTSDVVNFLKRDIPGYAVTNPAEARLVPPSMQPQLPFPQVF
ncbi:MAG: LPS-assembly protein LptD [Betaproteobacteria bacterium]|nr:LPS-assembly protein LptD [Betaproteobacteria bacterium]